ncbi:MAG: Carbamoyl-phosphate synthase small chain, partial [uncultured Nocardioidaceae bacterium]
EGRDPGPAGPRGRPHLPRRVLRRRGGDLRRGGLLDRDVGLPGDAHRPLVPPPGRRHDRAPRRQHRDERRRPRVPSDLGRGVRRARPGARPEQLAFSPRAGRRARGSGCGRDRRGRHPGPDPSPARARRDAGRHLH